MSSRPPSRVVFVGNIPYGLTEEQITEIFSSAGKVERFRLVYDSETGRPKGFGFADYPDTDSASSAVRNLNEYEIMGRKLRVDFSNEQKSGDDDNQAHSSLSRAHTSHLTLPYPPSGQIPTAPNGMPSYPTPQTALPPLPAGKEIPPGLTCTDAISRTLNTLPPPQLLDILSQMKSLAAAEPQRATELLQQAPQLAYAVFQALLLMGLVSPEAIQSVVDPAAAAAAAPAGNPNPNNQNINNNNGNNSNYPAAQAPSYPVANHTLPVAGAPFAQAPAPAPAPVPTPPMAASVAQDPDALMRAVMELPQAQIDMLPENDRQQIMALRATFAAQRR